MNEIKETIKPNKSIAKNTIFNFVCQFITLIAPLLTAPYLARVLNAELIGKQSYVASIVSFFSLIIVFGTNYYGVNQISQFRNNKEEKSKVFWEINLIKTITFLFSLFAYSFLIIFYKEYRILYLINLIALLSSYIDITWFFQGSERFDIISIRTLFTKIIAVVVVYVFIKDSSQFYLYVILSLLSTLIPNFLVLPSLKKEISKVNFKELNIKRHWKKLFPFFLSNSLISVYSLIDKTMIRLITQSDAEVGFYEQAHKIYALCSALTLVMGPVLSARISFVYNDKKKRDELFDIGFMFVYLFAFPIMVGCLMLSNQIIDVFFGSGYDESKTILMVFSVLPLISGVSMMTSYLYYNPTFRNNIILISCGIGFVLNIVLNFILTYYYGALGASIATIITEFVIATICIFWFKDANRKHLLLISWKYVLSAIIMGCVLFIMIKFLNTGSSLWNLVIYILLSAMCYFLILFVLREKMVLIGMQRLKKVFSKLKFCFKKQK